MSDDDRIDRRPGFDVDALVHDPWAEASYASQKRGIYQNPSDNPLADLLLRDRQTVLDGMKANLAAAESETMRAEWAIKWMEMAVWSMGRGNALEGAWTDLGVTSTFGEATLDDDEPFESDRIARDQSAVDLDKFLARNHKPQNPTRLVPADVPYVRSCCLTGSTVGAISQSRSVFVSTALTEALHRSDEPPEDFRYHLPFPHVCVVLAEPVRVEGARFLTKICPQRWGAEVASPGGLWSDDLEAWFHFAGPMYLTVTSDAVDIVGVVLTADPNGGIRDEVIWLTQAPFDPDEMVSHEGYDREIRSGDMLKAFVHDLDLNPMTYIAPVRARLSRSHLAPLARKIAALVAIKIPDGVDTPVEPLPESDKERRKLAKTGRFRRNVAHGNYSRVRVIDLSRAEQDASRPGIPTGRTVRSHWRRGHFRNQRYGPRGDEWTEPRWIAPVWVEGGRPAEGEQVWRATEAS